MTINKLSHKALGILTTSGNLRLCVRSKSDMKEPLESKHGKTPKGFSFLLIFSLKDMAQGERLEFYPEPS